jgi:thioesterase domain-containing protein/acyl carrier protein
MGVTVAGRRSNGSGGDQQSLEYVPAEGKLRRADLALSTPWKEPGTDAERKLAAIWQEVFEIDTVGVLDDFFELGGDSFTATTLATEIEAIFGKRFTPADIINQSTIEQQALGVVDESGGAELPACIVLGRAGGPKPPLFMVHGGKGFAFFGPKFFDIVGEERSIYLFQAPGLDGRTSLESIEEVVTLKDYARLYVEAMRQLQPVGPYNLVAMCSGSFIAVEMCEQLEKAGQAVRRLILLDPTSVPPAMRPPALAELREKKRAKRANRGLAGRLLDLLRGSAQNDEETDDYDPWEMPPKKEEDLRQRIQQRVQQMNDIAPEQRSFTEQRMFKMSQQFRTALYTHTPRPYPGKAMLLVSALRAKETLAEGGFWTKNLGGLEYQVLGKKHKDLFQDKLAETATFVRDALN